MLSSQFCFAWKTGKKVSNISAAEILRPSSLLDLRYLTLFRPFGENKNVGVFLNLIFSPSEPTYFLLGKLKKNGIKYALRTLKGSFSFDFEIRRINHGAPLPLQRKRRMVDSLQANRRRWPQWVLGHPPRKMLHRRGRFRGAVAARLCTPSTASRSSAAMAIAIAVDDGDGRAEGRNYQ